MTSITQPPPKQQYVALSGGKDSTALALLLPHAQPIFTDTGWEYNEIYAHLDKFESLTGRTVIRIQPAETLPAYIRRSKFMPGHAARFCTRMYKIDALNHWLSGQHANIAIGLRADEELRVGNQTDNPNITYAYPLRDRGLGIVDVLRICIAHDLLPRRLTYMARGGCKGCFYKRRSEVVAMHYLVPDELDELQELEEAVQDTRGEFAYMFPNMSMSIRQLREQLNQQPMLFDVEDVYRQASDTSDVGLACGLFCGR